jgi:Secretion system C-terminal sorting domain
MKNVNFLKALLRQALACLWSLLLPFTLFAQLSNVQPLSQSVVPFGFNGDLSSPRLQTFRSAIIYNPVVYALPQTFVNAFQNAQIDFGDGNGFVAVGSQTNRTITYPTVNAEKVIRLNTNGVVTTLASINVKSQRSPYVKPDEVWTISVPADVSWTRPASCANAYPIGNPALTSEQITDFNSGNIGKANVYIKFGKENGVTRSRLGKPVIFLDGLDFGTYSFNITDAAINNTTDATNKVIRYGDTGWDVIFTGTDESRLDGANDRELFANYPTAFARLLDDGYDILFVDFEKGADYIQKNGLLFREVVRKINREKPQNDCRAKNVVIGASMGGQIAKWTLKTMENAGENHDTHTYVSFDSPQKGAHIPLSIQAAAFWASRSGVNTGNPSLWQRLNFPAPRQLLLDNLGNAQQSGKIVVGRWEVSGLTGFGDILFTSMDYACLRNQYATEMTTLGYPKQTRNVAIACGSFSGGGQGYSDGTTIFHATATPSSSISTIVSGWTPPIFEFQVRSGNGNFSTLSVNRARTCTINSLSDLLAPVNIGLGNGSGAQNMIFAGAVPSKMASFKLSGIGAGSVPCEQQTLYVRGIQTMSYLDNAPGGSRSDLVGLKRLIAGAIGDFNADIQLDLRGLPDEITRNQCFIPVLSAFDVQQDMNNQSLYQDFQSPNLQHPFAAIKAPKKNLKHVEINDEITDFLLQQIKVPAINLGPTLRGVGANYNFANTLKKTLTSVEIGGFGNVKINGAGNSGYGDEPSNAPPTGFEVVTGGICGPSNIDVKIGGTLQVGESSRKGTLRIVEGSTVKIWSWGKLNIDQGSTVTIENGCKLIFQGLAQLANNGVIIVKAGGELIIDGQPTMSGSGYIRFEKDNKLTMNADWLIRGGNTNQRMIQIAQLASIVVAPATGVSSVKLTLQNGLVERERGNNGSGVDHIVVRPNAIIAATEVNFDDYSSGPSRYIVLDGHNTGEFKFERCSFNNTGIAVELREPANTPTNAERAYPWGRNNFKVNVRFIICTFQKSDVIRADRAYIVELNNCTVNGGGVDISYAYEVDIHNLTTMRGNYSRTAVKVKNVVHTELFDNSLIDQYDTGIDATESWNHCVTIFDRASIQSCVTGIKLKGGINNAYGLDWGMLYMDCSRMLENFTSIQGEDILFNMYNRGDRTNLFTRNSWFPEYSRFFDALFKCRRETDVWLHGTYWSGFVPNNASNNEFWNFNMTSTPCKPYPIMPWTGNLHINETSWWNGAVITNPNDPTIQNCGGLALRSPEQEKNDLMAQNTIVFADGQYRNVKIQQDAALEKLRQQESNAAENLFEPIARLSQNVRDTANAVVKHMIDVARVMVVGADLSNSNGFARNDHGWLQEATVYFDNIADNRVKLFPNPANDFCRVALKQGFDYEVNVYDAVGKMMESLDANADFDLNTKDWKSGVYMIQILNKTNHQRTHRKMVIQH